MCMPAGDSTAKVDGDREKLDTGQTNHTSFFASFGYLADSPN